MAAGSVKSRTEPNALEKHFTGLAWRMLSKSVPPLPFHPSPNFFSANAAASWSILLE